MARHFRLFALAEAGPGQPEDGFEVGAIVRHLQVFDRLFDALGELGCVDAAVVQAALATVAARSAAA